MNFAKEVLTCLSDFKMMTITIILMLSHAMLVEGKMNRQEEKQLDEKYGKLIEMSKKENVLDFNGNRFRKFARNSPRNYSMIIMFTALSTGRGCKICKQVSDEFYIAADSHKMSTTKQNQLQNTFFVSIDFDSAPDVFSIMNLDQAPVIMYFPEKGKPKNSDTMDIASKGLTADAIAKFVEEKTGTHIRVVRPTNMYGIIVIFVCFVLLCTIIYYRFDHLQFLYNSTMWGVMIVGYVVIMASGQMYNAIRGVPVAEKTSRGVSFVSSSPQYQYIAETYIVIMLYGGIVIGMIMLTDSKKGSSGKKRTLATFGIALIALFYSFTISLFRVKNPEYPFRFLFG